MPSRFQVGDTVQVKVRGPEAITALPSTSEERRE